MKKPRCFPLSTFLKAWFPFTWFCKLPPIIQGFKLQKLLHGERQLLSICLSQVSQSNVLAADFPSPLLLLKGACLSGQSTFKQQLALMVQHALTSNRRHILVCASWSHDEVMTTWPIPCLLSSFNSPSHWSWCSFYSYGLCLFFRKVSWAPCLPFMNHIGYPSVSASAMLSRTAAQPTSQCSNNTPLNLFPSQGGFTLFSQPGAETYERMMAAFPYLQISY